MRQRNVKNQEDIISSFDRYVLSPESNKGKWHEKYNEVRLEIGIGKGNFIYNMAKQNPDVLFVGIELNRGVIALAIKKILRCEKDENIKLSNILLFSYNAEDLEKVFMKGEINKIYLNFSDPWPKKKHAKRRLTSGNFLSIYSKILCGDVEQKTDNRGLFEYSIMSFNNNCWNILDVSLDIYKDIESGKILKNIPTEYEEKFREKGPIYKLIANFKED